MKKYVFLFVFILLVANVSAYNIFKEQLCNSANISTFGECDDYWTSFQETMGINETVVINNGLNSSDIQMLINKTVKSLLENIYNKSEVDIRVGNSTSESGITKEELDNVTINLRDSIAENYASQDTVDLLEREVFGNGRGDNTALYLLVGAVVVLGGYMWLQKKQASKSAPQGRPAIPKIESRKEMEEEKK